MRYIFIAVIISLIPWVIPCSADAGRYLVHTQKSRVLSFQDVPGIKSVEKLTGAPFYRVVSTQNKGDKMAQNLEKIEWVINVEKDLTSQICDENNHASAMPVWENQGVCRTAGWERYGGVFSGQGIIITPWQEVIENDILQRLSNGEGVTIAVIDSGLDVSSENFDGHIYVNEQEIPGDIIDNDGNGFVDDVYGWNFGDKNNDLEDLLGHGTNVSWLVRQTAPGAKLLVLKINQKGNSTFSDSDLVEAIYYAVNAGADLINLSLVLSGEISAVKTAINYAVESGSVVVAAAGNNPGIIGFPGSMEEVITVGSTMGKEHSSTSPASDCIDIAAPGEYVVTMNPDGGSTVVSGTSFSAPMVSGAAAVLMGMNRYLKPDTVKQLLFKGAEDLGNSGKDELFGWGLLNGTGLNGVSMPAVTLPAKPFYAFSASQGIKVDCYLPPTDTDTDIFIAIVKEDLFWWLDQYGTWQNGSKMQIMPTAMVNLDVKGIDFFLFDDTIGIWNDFYPSFLEDGFYQWGIALMKNGKVLAPVSWAYMYVFN